MFQILDDYSRRLSKRNSIKVIANTESDKIIPQQSLCQSVKFGSTPSQRHERFLPLSKSPCCILYNEAA